MIPYDLHYAFPWAAYLVLLLFPLWGLLGSLYRYRHEIEGKISPGHAIVKVMVPRSDRMFWAKAAMASLCWICASIALMGPLGNGHYPEKNLPGASKPAVVSLENLRQNANVILKRKAHDVIFLIDASASMSVDDTRTGVARLADAKGIADEIASTLNGETASLYAFTSKVDELSPPTMDYLYVRLMLRDIHINEGNVPGTNLVAALAEMKKRYFSEPAPKLRTLVLITDGGDTAIEGLTGTARQEAILSLTNFVSDAAALNLRVYTIGVGSRRGKDIPGLSYHGKPVLSKLQEDILQSLAHRGRGEYFFANDYTSVDIARAIYQGMMQDPPYYDQEKGLSASGLLRGMVKESGVIYDFYFQIPLALAIFLLALAIYLPDTKRFEEEVTA